MKGKKFIELFAELQTEILRSSRRSKDITLLTGEIIDCPSIRNALKTSEPDFIIHLAALTPVRDSFERQFEYYQANFLGRMGVAHAILELQGPQTRRLIAASTAEVRVCKEKSR